MNGTTFKRGDRKVGGCKVFVLSYSNNKQNYLRIESNEPLEVDHSINPVWQFLLETSLKFCEALFLIPNHFKMFGMLLQVVSNPPSPNIIKK